MFVLSPAHSDHTHVTTHSVHSKSPSHAPRPNHVIESVSNYNYSQRDLVRDSNQIMQFFLPPYTFIQAAKLVAALLRVVRVTAGLVESSGSLLPGL